MKPAEFEAGIQKLVIAITDETGNIRPISRIEFEIIGRQVRWNGRARIGSKNVMDDTFDA